MAQNLGLHMPCFLSLSPPCYTRLLPVPKWFIGFQFIIDISMNCMLGQENLILEMKKHSNWYDLYNNLTLRSILFFMTPLQNNFARIFLRK